MSKNLKIKDICEFIPGSQPPKTEFSSKCFENMVRLIQIRDRKNDDYITYIDKKYAKRTCTKDDILIGRYGPPIFQVFRGFEGAYNVALLKAEPKDIILKDYLYYFLIQDSIHSYVDSMSARTAGQTGVELDSLYEYPVILPSKEEQKLVQNVLLAIDNKIQINNKINQELEKLAKTLYDYWFVQFDFPDENNRPYKSSGGSMVYNETLKRNIPVNWNVNNITEHCDIIDCLHSKKPDSYYETEDSYLLQLENLTSTGYIEVNNKYYISQEDYKFWTQRIEIKENDFVFTNAGRTGAFGKIPAYIKCALGRNFTAVRPKNISAFYLRMFFSSNDMKQQILSNLDCGAFFKSFNVKSIKLVNILIPTNKILSNFVQVIAPIVQKIEINNENNQSLIKLRDFLLPMLMNGQVAIND